MTHNLTQPSTTNTQQEPVTQVPASLVTTKPLDQGIPPPPPPPRGLTPPTKRIFPAKSTEHIAEALRGYVRTRTNGTCNEEIQKIPTETEH